jgi:hypothetical protein
MGTEGEEEEAESRRRKEEKKIEGHHQLLRGTRQCFYGEFRSPVI